MMKQFKILASGLLATCCINALASDVTANMSVTSTITTTCTVTSGNLNFGPFDPSVAIGSGNGEATTTVNVTCTDATPYSVYLNAGLNGTIFNREMLGQTHAEDLSYQIFVNSGYTEIWGDGTVGTDYNCGIGNGTAQAYTAYGQIVAGQTSILADTYNDTIQVDVSY